MSTTSFANATDVDCIIVRNEEKVLISDGKDCNRLYSPNSTFKIPLALIGFEDRILKSAHILF